LFIIAYFYFHNYNLRFALVPVVEDQFTLEGYTLFSARHIIDYINLIFVLMPGFLMAMTLALAGNFNLRQSRPRIMFLLLASITSLGLIFVIDPRLGMARDWDLLAFAAIPLTLLIIDLCLFYNKRAASGRMAVKMMVLIGMFTLISRAVSMIDPGAALPLLANNMRNDWIKYSNVVYSLKQYVEWGGDRELANPIIREHQEKFRRLTSMKALEDFKAGNYEDAARGFELEIEFNPQRAFPYGYLAMCRMQAGLYDSAIVLLEIAHGLDNYNLGVIDELGSCYAVKGKFEKAKKYFTTALSLEKDHIPALAKLTTLYMSAGDLEKSSEYYRRLSAQSDVLPLYFYTIGNDYESRGYNRQALEAYGEAVRRGLPEEYRNQLKSRYPQLFR
jgi:tetratricopeptide (TPR) repeat protein